MLANLCFRDTHLLFRQNLRRHNHESNPSFSARLGSNQRGEEDNALAEARRDDKEKILSVIEVFAVCELMWVE
jgi:hypothetical protein